MNLFKGDCLDQLKLIPDCSIDSIVTDPPYGLAFMGKKWDYDVPSVEIWKEVLRVLKPGGHLLSFGGTRTYHRMVINIEDAGFEIRDQIMWIYGSGFPKSMDISKAIDKQAGAEREVIGKTKVAGGIHRGTMNDDGWEGREQNITAPATESAKQWQGWGTALKPANEPICLARKPISEKTVASNVLKHGTGAMNIDESRVGENPGYSYPNGAGGNSFSVGNGVDGTRNTPVLSSQGRWPANVIFDEEAGKILDEQTKDQRASKPRGGTTVNRTFKDAMFNMGEDSIVDGSQFNDSGGASRFFYCAKTSKSERNAGLEGMPEKQASGLPMRSKDGDRGGEGIDGSETDRTTKNQNFHPTVKPIKLMTYLIKLITPPGGIVLDPFMGSGSTGVAAKNEGFKFVGIERDEEYFKIASNRIERSAQSELSIKG
jgi:DNA modification methylase